jgi:multiple sugar transport system permease protein
MKIRATLLVFIVTLLFVPFSAMAIQIDIWDFPRWLEPGETVDRFAWIKKQISRFEAENPGVQVKLTELSWSRGDEKLKIAALGGHFPDIAPGTVPLLFIRENLIAPIDEFLTPEDRNDYLPGALKAFQVKGKTYGWPWYMGGQLLFVNRDMFASAGVDLPVDGRWSPEGFQERLSRLRAFHTAEPGFFPLGVYFQKNETANFPFLLAFGGDWFPKDGLNASMPSSPSLHPHLAPGMAAEAPEGVFPHPSRELLTGFSYLTGLLDAGLIPPDSGGRTSNDVWTAFARERRMAVGAFGLWAAKALTDKFPMNFDIMHFPAPAGREAEPFLGISGFFVFRRGDPARTAAAMKFSRFLTESQAQRSLKLYSQFPTRQSAGEIYDDTPAMKRAWEVLRHGRTVLADARWPQMDEEIETGIQRILLKKAAAPEELLKCNTRIAAIFQREDSSITESLQAGSWIGRLYLALFPLVLLFALASRQIHLIMLLPAFTIMGLFLYYPMVDALFLAFREYRIGAVGGYTLQNFILALSDRKFLIAAFNTVLYTLLVVPANVIAALVISSMIFSLPETLKKFFRASYYLPGVASVVVLSMVWKFLLNREVGLFNQVLGFIGISPIGWLTDPDVAMYSIILTGILRSPGGAILIYLASLANIPKSLYEAADLEGATPLQKWRYITVPLLKGTTMFLIITGTIDALQVFAQVLMLTNGGPADATEVVVHRIYTAAFRDFNFGVSSAMALILFAAILFMTMVQRRLQSESVGDMA